MAHGVQCTFQLSVFAGIKLADWRYRKWSVRNLLELLCCSFLTVFTHIYLILIKSLACKWLVCSIKSALQHDLHWAAVQQVFLIYSNWASQHISTETSRCKHSWHKAKSLYLNPYSVIQQITRHNNDQQQCHKPNVSKIHGKLRSTVSPGNCWNNLTWPLPALDAFKGFLHPRHTFYH